MTQNQEKNEDSCANVYMYTLLLNAWVWVPFSSKHIPYKVKTSAEHTKIQKPLNVAPRLQKIQGRISRKLVHSERKR